MYYAAHYLPFDNLELGIFQIRIIFLSVCRIKYTTSMSKSRVGGFFIAFFTAMLIEMFIEIRKTVVNFKEVDKL